jgi:hypothetical protein
MLVMGTLVRHGTLRTTDNKRHGERDLVLVI